jgi:imidazolonepropionase-like amidohydrolase
MIKITAFLLLSLTLLLASGRSDPEQKALVLTHVTIIDITGGAPKSDMTVVITGARITDLGEAGKVSLPQGGRVIDASGKFLIPGLWDMHVHWYDRNTLTLFTANGVTGIRQMFGNSDLLRWRDEIAKGSLQGPRMVVASPIIDGPQPIWPNSISVRDEAEGRKAVTRVKQWGADFVKVYSLLPREAYFGIADEARKQGLPFEGHVPFTVSAAEASDAGQKSIEHMSGVILACSDKEAEPRSARVNANSPPARPRAELQALGTFSAQKEAELFARFIKNGTWQCPTLTVQRSTAYQDDPNFKNDGRLRFIPRHLLERWGMWMANRRAEFYANAKRLFQKELEVIGDMNRAGVLLLAGTDTYNPFCFPGFSLHDELALLVKAGLTPTESLRAATLNPAKFLGLDQTLGTIEQGKLADLVLLEANPLEDIRNTQRIDAVIMNGRFYDRKALDKMLAQAQTLANQR